MTGHDSLLLSVRPIFAERILKGSKTTELRRVKPAVFKGQEVLIYSSSPTKALVGFAVVEHLDLDHPDQLWSRVKNVAGVSHAEYLRYFEGAAYAAAIALCRIGALSRPIPLQELRRRWPWFRPPQSYCFVQASLHQEQGRIRSLSPRILLR